MTESKELKELIKQSRKLIFPEQTLLPLEPGKESLNFVFCNVPAGATPSFWFDLSGFYSNLR